MPTLMTPNLVYGQYSQIFEKLYPNPKAQPERWSSIINGFLNFYGNPIGNLRLFSAPGRVEIGGNHTDHQHGAVLAAAINLDTACAAAKTDNNKIRIKSVGHREDIIDLSDLDYMNQSEANHASALIRGICVGMQKNGWKIGSFDAFTSSDVKSASGLSSSAAFEIAVGTIISHLYNDGKIPPLELAQIGQFAENNFFGKPCGLMDQAASAFGGFVFFDFSDPSNTYCERIPFDFSASKHSLIIVHTGGGHGNLTGEFIAIAKEMTSVANMLGKSHLRYVAETDFNLNISKICEKLGDRAVLRAIHFFEENRRALLEATALKSGDIDTFKTLVNASGQSSFCYLQNLYVPNQPQLQPLSLAIALSDRILSPHGAFRVHGGGFAGTVLAVVPDYKLEEYISQMSAVFGEKSCQLLSIRTCGGVEILPNHVPVTL